MEAWRAREPVRPDRAVPVPVLTDSRTLARSAVVRDGVCRLYVCGITPYDATHLGHASTYLTFDLVNRLARASGAQVQYTQNVTDVDDPLLERAAQTGRDWRELAAAETRLFREDMAYLDVLPPDRFVSVSEAMPRIAGAVLRLLGRGLAYPVAGDGAAPDLYLDLRAARALLPDGTPSGTPDSAAGARAQFDANGGDSRRPGKRDPLDSLLWRAERVGEPSWRFDGLPAGRPGWHIECAVIAAETARPPADLQGGGMDLLFPHHEYSSAHTAALFGQPIARTFAHVGLVSFLGEKMSKSLGNLVLIRDWRRRGLDPSVARLAILSHHYRQEWEWHDSLLSASAARIERWRLAAAAGGGAPDGVQQDFVAALASDIDTVGAFDVLDAWASGRNPSGGGLVALVEATTGIRLGSA